MQRSNLTLHHIVITPALCSCSFLHPVVRHPLHFYSYFVGRQPRRWLSFFCLVFFLLLFSSPQLMCPFSPHFSKAIHCRSPEAAKNKDVSTRLEGNWSTPQRTTIIHAKHTNGQRVFKVYRLSGVPRKKKPTESDSYNILPQHLQYHTLAVSQKTWDSVQICEFNLFAVVINVHKKS